MTAPAAQQRCCLGDSPPEIGHPLAQAEFLRPDAAGLLEHIGVATSGRGIGFDQQFFLEGDAFRGRRTQPGPARGRRRLQRLLLLLLTG